MSRDIPDLSKDRFSFHYADIKAAYLSLRKIVKFMCNIQIIEGNS
ncbi:hypothetical protein Cyrtocomes_00819 [Candidatus Cyrtobacter comes]|uniref:Uncharacterized protein n=1 Tax=Candidatus Cyrtobacter comes TaxID=675776 RepID=A0ABU5L8I8_9RICK|nr:hypothetical protein [Candidatus Cyrtobacter comes]